MGILILVLGVVVVFIDFIVIIVRESDTIDVSNTKGGEMNKYQTVVVDSDESMTSLMIMSLRKRTVNYL